MDRETKNEKCRKAAKKGRVIYVLKQNGIEARRGPYRKLQVRCATLRFHAGLQGDWNFLQAPHDLRAIQRVCTPIANNGAAPPTLEEILDGLRHLADKGDKQT